jgi:hypothetical protein
MGLDQRIIKVKNKSKVNKLIKKDLWTNYVKENSDFDVPVELDGMVLGGFSFFTFGATGMTHDYKKMNKDGFVVEKEYRKFNELQGWFERNCNIENLGNVRFTENNINKLLKDIEQGNLIKTEGLFYGDFEMEEEDRVDLIETLNSIKNDIVKNNEVYLYTCWY